MTCRGIRDVHDEEVTIGFRNKGEDQGVAASPYVSRDPGTKDKEKERGYVHVQRYKTPEGATEAQRSGASSIRRTIDRMK